MSDSSGGNLHETATPDGPGILAGLPRTRPQRTSARRVAARVAKPSAANAASPRQAGATPPRAARKRPATKARAASNKRPPAKHGALAEGPAPRQGFEAEPDTQGAVQPPGGAELVASLAELAGELAKAGVNTGGRVLKDVLSRLPR